MKLVIALTLAAFVAAVPIAKLDTTATEDSLWQRFKMTYNKVYFDSRDESYRKFIFTNNLRMIQKHNEEQESGQHEFSMAMNEFGDLTYEEFHSRYIGYEGPELSHLRSMNTANLSDVEAPDSMDWTEKGAVTGVKNQGQCGSCWAFSATGAIEGAWFIAKGKLENLSEQELMDCSRGEGNHSCNGGLMDYAFEWVIKNRGICSESDYPYKARDQNTCNKCDTVASISAYKNVPQSEDGLKAAVSQQPVSVAIEASSAFQFYSSGVMTGTCGSRLNHGVLAVGYGSLNNVQYWKLKNSWGTSWGMNGYILIEKGKKQSGGQCGILLASSYPVV